MKQENKSSKVLVVKSVEKLSDEAHEDLIEFLVDGGYRFETKNIKASPKGSGQCRKSKKKTKQRNSSTHSRENKNRQLGCSSR